MTIETAKTDLANLRTPLPANVLFEAPRPAPVLRVTSELIRYFRKGGE